MIVESPELLAVANRWLNAQIHREDETLEGMFSDSEHLRYIGTGPDEVWAGHFIKEAYPSHVREIPRFEVDAKSVEAFENGKTGWVNWIGDLKFEHIDDPRRFRITWIFVLENGSWKVVNAHLSTPRSNVEIAGHEHFAFSELIEAARHSSDKIGRGGTAIIMLTDIVGSTALNAELGDEVWATRINEHFSDIETIVQAEQGMLVKSLGDGTMSNFVSVKGALRAANNIQRKMALATQSPRLQVRIGVHTGDVIQTGDDFFGHVVNTAARITEAATADQTLVSEAVRNLAQDWEHQFGETISLNIRGIDGVSRICALHW